MHGLMRAADQKPAALAAERDGGPEQAGRPRRPGGRSRGGASSTWTWTLISPPSSNATTPSTAGVPLVVCHTSSDFCTHGVVATASYEARLFGIKAGMSVWEARSRCPGVAMVHADIPKYLYNTRRLVRLCETYSPRSEVFSIDEVFLDLTHRVGPGEWEAALGLAAELKRRIREELGLTCSVGLGPNKLVAKMAAEFEKPDGLTIIRPDQLPDHPRPSGGEQAGGGGAAHAQAYARPGHRARRRPGPHPGAGAPETLRGHGPPPPPGRPGHRLQPGGGQSEDDLVKSFGHSLSLRGGTDDVEVMANTLLGLAEAVTRRMRRDGYLGRTVCLRLRIGYGRGCTRSVTLKDYTALPRPIFQAARALLEREAATGTWEENITTVGLSVSSLQKRSEGCQLSIWGWLDPREEKLFHALDGIRDKYGEGIVTRASLLGTFEVSGMNLAR